jgi:transglutaminase-like putative cysteine protease
MKVTNAIKPFVGRVFRICFPLVVLLWILLVLYPNPLNLIVSLQRAFNPDIDPVFAESLSRELPSDPVAIEDAVLQRIPYSYDWESYGMPWYVPTVEEILEKGKGDCKARALVLASVFETKGIPYRISWSPIHMWVEYEGKEETAIENPSVEFYQQDPETGERSFRLPEIPFSDVMYSFWQGFWDPMPGARKALLLIGLPALVKLRLSWFKKGKGI